MAVDISLDADSQDQAESFDETNITRDGVDIAHPDTARDVYDVTSAPGDADDDDDAPDVGDADVQVRSPPPHDHLAERRLDEDLKETFPASDPGPINPGAD